MNRSFCMMPMLLVMAWLPAVQMPWAKSFQEAQAKAKAGNKFVLVYFYSPRCEECDAWQEEVWTSARIVKLIPTQSVPVRLDFSKEGKSLAAKHKVASHHSILYLDARGQEVGRFTDSMPEILFHDENNKLIDAARAWPTIQREYAANPKSGEANAKMAWALGIRREREDAERHLASAKKLNYKGPYLARAYNMIADIYQLSNQVDKALDYFKKADAATKVVKDKSYSKVSIMACYLQKGEMAKAREAARDLVALKGATPEYVAFAKEVLAGGPNGRGRGRGFGAIGAVGPIS